MNPETPNQPLRRARSAVTLAASSLRLAPGYRRAIPPGQKQGWRVAIFTHFTRECIPGGVKWHFTLLRNVTAPPRGLPDSRRNVTAAALRLPD